MSTSIDDVELLLLRRLEKVVMALDGGRSEETDRIHVALEEIRKLAAVNTSPVPPPACPCGWNPYPGIIGGETLAEHQAFCPKAPKVDDRLADYYRAFWDWEEGSYVKTVCSAPPLTLEIETYAMPDSTRHRWVSAWKEGRP